MSKWVESRRGATARLAYWFQGAEASLVACLPSPPQVILFVFTGPSQVESKIKARQQGGL